MPNSLRNKIKKFHYQGKLSDTERDRLLDALDVVERQTGHWIVFPSPDEQHCGLVKCPYCKEELIAEPDEYHYCPSCGARMKEGVPT